MAQQNIAVDANLDLMSFAQQASNLTGGNVTFITLPVDHFGKDPIGEDVNIVNVAAIQAQVQQLIGGGTPPPAASPSTPRPQGAPVGVTVDVLNATGRQGLASQLQQALSARGYTAGKAGNDDRHLTRTRVEYPPGQDAAATTLASLVGSTEVVADRTIPGGHLRVVEGTDLTLPPSTAAGPPPVSAPTGTAAASANGSSSTPPALNPLAGGGVPCVK